METIKGAVKKIIFQNTETGFKVIKAQIPTGPLITLTGEFGPEIVNGAVADFHGDYRSHAKYGTHFRVASFHISHNVEELSSIKLFIDAIAPNIGSERAHLIVEYFGNDTIDILDNNPERLIEVEGIGKISTESLSEAWKKNRERWQKSRQDYTLRAFLNSLGIKESRVKRILKYFGGGLCAEESIKENPYRLTEVEGFGFTTADFVAHQLGTHKDSPQRFKAFILYSLNTLCPANGHLYMTINDLVDSINKYSLEVNTVFLGKKIIVPEDTVNFIKELVENKSIVEDSGDLYSFKCYQSEKLSAIKLSNIITAKSELIFLNRDFIQDYITIFERENEITLSEEQRDALYYFIEKKVYVITGLPGSGKCLGFNTLILMYDESIKMVQNIIPGDLLMGDDFTPRKVYSICRGQEQMYTVIQDKGCSYIINRSHILSLKRINSDQIYDIPLINYLNLNDTLKNSLKGYKKSPDGCLLSDIKIEPLGIDDYYGFEIDGNGRFLLGDRTVTHNTTVLKAIVSLVNRLKLKLICMAPTGISAKKIASTVNYEAYTIHRRLGFRGDHWIYGEDNKYETDVVLVDESSMLDMEVFYRLVSALKNRVHLIFIGDSNQLPSVGAGNVLRELIQCQQIPVIKLERIFRQDEASDIIKVAHSIKQGNTDLNLFKSDPKSDVVFLRESNIEKIENYIIKIATKLKNKKDPKIFQIITPRKDGPLSTKTLNQSLQNVLNPHVDPSFEINCGKFILRKGDRIIVIKNDYEKDVYNGEIGKIIDIRSGDITIQMEDKNINLSPDEINDKIQLAYTLTCHKSQGQEYPYIILPFVNQFGKNLLQRNLLYTAITRAKEKVIIIGHGSAIERAINNSSVYKRNTRLGQRIKECLLKETID